MRYEELAHMYELEDAYWWFVSRRRLVRALIEQFGPPNPRILDVGCGTGGTLDALADLGTVCGADRSADAIAFCRRRGHTTLSRCRAEALAFANDSFDVAVCCDVFEHLVDDLGAMGEVLRVLKPGGVAIITVPAYQWLWSEHDEALSHERRYSRRQLADRLKVEGAEVVKITYAVSLVFPLVLMTRLLSRLRLRRLGVPHTQLMQLPRWANRFLLWLQDLESAVISRAGFPFGTSVVAVARKPMRWAAVRESSE